MTKSSRQVVFINTSPPEDRVQSLKPLKDINEMEDDSQDVYAKGLIDRYAKWAQNLEDLSLADWVAWYDLCGKPKNKKTNVVDVDNLPLERGIMIMTMMKRLKMIYLKRMAEKSQNHKKCML